MRILKRLYKYIRFWGGPYRCSVCLRRTKKFFPLSTDLQIKAKSNGFAYDFRRMETLNYQQCNCPFCLSSDRERLYIIYLEEHFNNSSKRYSILDFAPNKDFSRRLRAKNYSYSSTDLYRSDVDVRMDICDMKEIPDHQFDLVICSHVLEHVPDPDKALKEIFRILRPGGKAIIMVPLFWDVKDTIEDGSHQTDELRLKYYGQADHVRLFSRNDFLDRLGSAGFGVEQLRPSHFDQKKIKENAIADNSILYICHRPEIMN